ncbi:MAG: DUF488 family protein [Nitrospirae bacterium]|nr:DUF488 family protein [Nitrospirota bacterium]
MLKETWLGNVKNVKQMNPTAVIINVTRSAGSKLSPSWNLLNAYKTKKIDWNGYTSRFLQEMDNPKCRAKMYALWELSQVRDVYLVCFEKEGNCHRHLLLDLMNEV